MFDETTRSSTRRTVHPVSGYKSVIPKEQQTAFERWELASFDPQPAEKTPDNTLATLAEIENLRLKARDEGYTQGHEAGYAEGYAKSYTAGIQQAQLDSAQIHALLQNLQEALNQVDEHLAQSLLNLSLEIGRKMTGEVLRVNPEIILKIVNDAINVLPHFNQNAHLILHPDDAELVKKQMGDQLAHSGWKIFTDIRIQRGGCRVETAHSQVDASTEARWKRVVEAIGLDKSWLA